MLGRLAVCAAVLIAASILLAPSPVSARGHGVHAATFHHHGHRHNRFPFGYAYLPPFGYHDDLPPDMVAVSYPLYAGPRCIHTVDSVLVPAESGGLRRITITRC